MWKRSAMATEGNTVNWKEHLGTRKCRLRRRRRRRVEVLRAASDGSAIDDVIDILNKLPNGVGSAESCNEEAPGERRINLQCSIEGHSVEQTAQDSGSKQVATSAQLCCLRTTCKEDTAEGFTLSAGSTNFQLEGLLSPKTKFLYAYGDEGKKPEACHISGSQERETLLPADGFTMRQVAERSTLSDSCEEKMGEDDDSQVVEDMILFDSRDEMMREYGGLDRFGSEDMGDADSDAIYSEGFPSSDEMGDDIFDETFDAMCVPNYSDEDTGEEDEGSEQHHGFDENTGEDDACEQPQRMEVDNGSAAFKEIDCPTMSAGRTFVQLNWQPSLEAFLSPEDHERIRELGIGTHVQSKKPSSVSWYRFPELSHTNGYYTYSNIMPIEVVHVSKENSAAFDTHEEKFRGSDFSTLFGLLDDVVEVQFERGNVRRWAFVDFSSLSYKNSLRLINSIIDMCATIGMKFYSSPLLLLARVKPATWDDIVKTLLDMRKKIFDLSTKLEEEGEEESEVFLLVILPDDKQYDGKIKELCEILKVAYELSYPITVCDIFKSQLKKTARRIQSKVVKRDVRRRRLALPLVSEAPMIIFGADLMLHCMPGEGPDSIATVAASLDWPKFRKYFVKESYQPYGEGIIKDLHNSNGGIMIDFFNSFYKIIKKKPQRIIFFRNGLQRGQFGPICQQEIGAIKRACALFNDRCQPQLTYVVVLPTSLDMVGMTDESNDIGPGTEANPIKFKFWCCHRGQKNNSFSLVCYYVVHDDNNFPARKLQSLTSKLCTFRHRWANPGIDIVPPAYYAQTGAVHAVLEWRRKKKKRLPEVTLPRDNK